MKGQKWIATSVILLFVCLTIIFFSISSAKQNKKESGVIVTYAADKGDRYNLNIEYFEKLRNYYTYHLNSDSTSNEKILIDFRNRLNEIKKNGDTINGVHLIMGDSTAYKYYIKTIDICNEKEPRVFAPYENHIYALYVSISRINPETKKLKCKMDSLMSNRCKYPLTDSSP